MHARTNNRTLGPGVALGGEGVGSSARAYLGISGTGTILAAVSIVSPTAILSARRWAASSIFACTFSNRVPLARRQVPLASSSQASTSSASSASSTLAEARCERRILDRGHHLDPPIQIARHQVGRSDREDRPARVAPEAEDPGMLEESSHDRTDPDPIRQARDPRPQAADAPDDQIDLRAGLGGAVELVDQLGVGEAVDLDDDAPVRGICFASDQLRQAAAEGARGDPELPEALLLAVRRQVVEELGEIGADLGIAREESEVFVAARRIRVVVARSDMAVAADRVALAADDERRLAVGLEADHAVHDMDARLLEGAGPGDVRLLVEARRQLDQGHDLLAGGGGLHEGVHAGVAEARGAVEGVLDGEHGRIGGSLTEEALDRGREGFVGVVDEEIAVLETFEEIAGRPLLGPEGGGGHRAEGRMFQVGAIDAVDRPERAEVEQRIGRVEIPGLELELGGEQRLRLFRQAGLDLDANGVVRPQPALQRRDHREQQVVCVALLDREIRIPGHAERMAREDVGAGKEDRRMGRDDLLDGNQLAGRTAGQEAGQERRDLHAGETVDAGLPVANHQGEVQREVRDVGEGMGGIDGEGRQYGEDLLVEMQRERRSRLPGELGPALQHDARFGELRREVLLQQIALPLHQVDDPRPHGGELLLRLHAVR